MNWKTNALSFVLGALGVLAFAPFECYPVIFVSLVGLIHLASHSGPKQAFIQGFSFGLGMYLFGVSWVYVSLSTYGGMPLWMGSIAVLGFASLLAVFSALPMFIAAAIARGNRMTFTWVVPFSWVVFEWCKSWVLTGFPWLDIGYTQTPSGLFSWAPIGGVYLVSFIVMIVSVLLLRVISMRSLSSAFLLIALFAVSLLVNRVPWTSPVGAPLSVGIVQANIAIQDKWLKRSQPRALRQYQRLSADLASNHLDLVVWPETALPLYAGQLDGEFWRSMSPPGTAVIAGLLDHDGTNSYNAAALSCPDNRDQIQLYRKRHLVPFGEYQPLQFLFAWVFEYLQLPMSDFAGWQGQQPLACGAQLNVGLSICYEDAFSNEYKDHVGEATMLVNISEDAWFGDSFAPHQRRQLAQMRARELGRPLVRAANSGPSLFIDAQGSLQRVTEQFTVAVAQHQVQPMTGRTPFMIMGSWIVWLSLMALAVWSLLLRRKKAKATT